MKALIVLTALAAALIYPPVRTSFKLFRSYKKNKEWDNSIVFEVIRSWLISLVIFGLLFLILRPV